MAKMRYEFERERDQSGEFISYNIKKCSHCFQYSVRYFCTSCQDNLCKKCMLLHLLRPGNTVTWHNIVDYRDKNRGIVQRRACEYHNDFTSTAYCYKCNHSICEQCTDHKKQETVSISELLRENVDYVLGKLENLSQNVKPAIERKYQIYLKHQRMLDQRKNEVRQDIFQYIQKMQDRVNLLRDSLLSELEDEIKKWKNEYSRFMLETEREYGKVTKTIQNTKKLLKDVHVMHNPELLPMKVADESEYHLEEPIVEVPHIYLLSSEITNEFLRNICAIIAEGNSKVIVKESEIDEFNCKEFENEIKDMSYNTEQDTMYVTESGKKAVCEINHAGEITRAYSVPCEPKCATVCNIGVIYGNPSNNTVEIIPFEVPEKAIVIMSTEDCFPRGISVSPSEEILVCLHAYDVKLKESHGKVVVIRNYDSKSEKEVITIEYDHNDEVLYQGPKYVVMNKNDICVSDRGSLVAVDSLGKLKFKYRKGYSKFTLNPQNVNVDSNSHILLLDLPEISAVIHIINEEGHFVQYLIVSGLLKPTAMIVDRKDRLFVADGPNGKIKIWPLRSATAKKFPDGQWEIGDRNL